VNTLVTKHKVLTTEKINKFLYKIVYYLLAVILPLINTLKLLPIINEQLVVLTATILPILEIGLGLLMLLKIKPNVTLPVVLMLFFIFFVFSIYGTVVGFDTDCGCFGNTIKSEFGWGMILRNTLLFILSGYINFNKKFLARKNITNLIIK